MQDEHYNLPMVRENFISRNIKKIFQNIFSIKRKKRKNRRASITAPRIQNENNVVQQPVEEIPPENRRKIDIYEFQAMYTKGEIPIENMNEDQKYALIKLFEIQNENLKKSIDEHKKNTEAYNMEVERLKKELELIK